MRSWLAPPTPRLPPHPPSTFPFRRMILPGSLPQLPLLLTLILLPHLRPQLLPLLLPLLNFLYLACSSASPPPPPLLLCRPLFTAASVHGPQDRAGAAYNMGSAQATDRRMPCCRPKLWNQDKLQHRRVMGPTTATQQSPAGGPAHAIDRRCRTTAVLHQQVQAKMWRCKIQRLSVCKASHGPVARGQCCFLRRELLPYPSNKTMTSNTQQQQRCVPATEAQVQAVGRKAHRSSDREQVDPNSKRNNPSQGVAAAPRTLPSPETSSRSSRTSTIAQLGASRNLGWS